jgi:tetratricopeptide (TPR) repeat protein
MHPRLARCRAINLTLTAVLLATAHRLHAQAVTQPATTQPATSPVEDADARLKAAFALETTAYTTQAPADYRAAAEALEKCSAADPSNLKVEQAVGYLWLEKLNEPERALPHLERVYAKTPDKMDWAYLLAKAAGICGKTDRQIEVLRAIVKQDPTNTPAKEDLAAALGEPATTQTSATTQPTTQPPPDAFAIDLQRATDLETAAYTSDAKQDYQAAADAFEKCSKSNPDDLQVERSVGFIWLDKLKDPERAYPHLEKAYALSPDDAGWGSLLAKAAGETGRSTRQLQVLREAATRNPTDANAHMQLAQALDKDGQHQQAGNEFAAALKLSPDDASILAAYGQYLHSRGRDIEAKSLADKLLTSDPKSAPALALEGDLHRNDWDLDQAQAAYQQALASDPYSETAKAGLTEILHNRAPALESNYYYFRGSDHFMQQGLYDTMSLSSSGHVYENATYNMGYFKDTATKYPSVIRYQEGIGIEDRVDSVISIRGGLGAFQQPKKEAFGFDLGATWKPTNELWIDASCRTQDPVTDSMYTVATGLSQDILAFTGGYQLRDDLAMKFAASRSAYSDDVTRQYIHVEPAYTLWYGAKLNIGAEYETVKFSRKLPGDGGTNWYQTFGPVFEAEPPINDWLSIHFRGELPYVATAYQWGTNLNLGLTLHPGDHLTVKAGVFYVHVPESISSYSGTGFDASVSYRF